jgi:hypothetical protein
MLIADEAACGLKILHACSTGYRPERPFRITWDSKEGPYNWVNVMDKNNVGVLFARSKYPNPKAEDFLMDLANARHD